ncbi:OmpP1/FadL family transporter [Shimia thalassica]|uniref:OmpP1/FadL family transporter n=1 Tax=Shimia thalassica TaxID=1715693 RepID=UPI003F73D2C5
MTSNAAQRRFRTNLAPVSAGTEATQQSCREEIMIRELTVTGATCLALSAGGAYAGGLDLSGQPIMPLFGKGTRAELSFANIRPDVSGSDFTGQQTGDVGVDFNNVSLSYKTDISDRFSVAVIVDQPFFRHTEYSSGFFTGTNALVESTALTIAGRYKFDDRWSIHGGLRVQQMEASTRLPALSYALDTSKETDFGFILGAAYEIPEYHVLVALTYNSEISHNFAATENGFNTGSFEFTTPEAFNLDFRTPVSTSTLVFGNIRYALWGDVDITPPSSGTLVTFADDTIRYRLGVVQKFTDTWSGLVRVTYEASQDSAQNIFNPTDGTLGFGIGAIYTADKFDVAIGVDYLSFGGTTGSIGTFNDSSGIAFGVRVGYNF